MVHRVGLCRTADQFGVFFTLFEGIYLVDSRDRAFNRIFRALATILGIFVRTRLYPRLFIGELFTYCFSGCFVPCKLAYILRESTGGERCSLLGQSMY